jgi:hypothetical protein
MQLITTPNPNAKKVEIEHGLEVGTVIKSTSGIGTIFAGPGFLTLTKEEDSDWDSINDDIVTQLDKL